MKPLNESLKYFAAEFIEEAEACGIVKVFDEDTEILKIGQYIKFIPLVLEGTVKVFTKYEDKELLLYYIDDGRSCIMSLNAGLKNTPSKVFAVAEKGTTVVLFPVEKMNNWVRQYPSVNLFFYDLYYKSYDSLITTINHLLYSKLDQRLYHYLLEMSKQKNSTIIEVRHRQIAAELGTAREVISRVMKKLESEGKVKQLPDSIEIFDTGD